MENTLRQKVGLTIIELRKEKQISQEHMAADANIGRHYMSDIENGKRNLSLDVIERICAYLNISLSDFFARVEHK